MPKQKFVEFWDKKVAHLKSKWGAWPLCGQMGYNLGMKVVSEMTKGRVLCCKCYANMKKMALGVVK